MIINVSILNTLVLYKNLNRLSKINFSSLVAVFLISIGVNAQVIYENPITGPNPNTSNPYIIGQVNNSNLSVSGIGRGSGISGSSGNNRYSANNWTQGTSSSSNDYFYWTITPNSCNEIDFSSLALTFERSASGPQNFALRSSIDNYATDIWTYNYTTTTLQAQTISLASASFQNVTADVTFLIYGWSATSGSGTFSINSFTFNGSVNATTSPVAGNITGISSVCQGSSSTLSLSGFTGNVQWQSSTNNTTFSNINGATNATYTTPNLSSTAYYRASVALGNCDAVFSPSFAVSINQSNFTPTGASACGPASLVLSANSVCPSPNSTIQWYSSQTGGSPIASGNNFTTPVLNSTTTYYVVNNIIAGNTVVGDDDTQDEDIGLVFNVTSTMLLNSIQVEANHNGSITIQLFNSAGNPIPGFPALVFPVSTGLNTLNLGWSIPVGSGYQLLTTNISNSLELTITENFSYPMSLGNFGTIVDNVGSGNNYYFFYNWNISSPRIPVTATISPVSNNTTTASACDTYTWSVNGTTYTTSGTYTSVTGCHTETLVLTVNSSSIYYVDADGDGFGSATTANFCAMPSTGYSLNNTDCNDAVATIYPGAPELCNTVDDNCNGVIDEGCPSTIPGEEPFNALSATSTYYSYCNSFYGTLAGAFPSDLAQSTCETGEDVWYSFTALTSGITIFIGSNANDIVIELQDVNGNLIDIEDAVNGVGTEVLSTNGLIPGGDYIFGIRNKNSNVHPGGQYSACIRHLRRGGSDSGTSATWPSTLSTCALFKAIYCGGTGVQYRYTWSGVSGSAIGQVFTKTQTSDYLSVTAVTPSLHAGCTYNVLVTAIYSIPNGTGAIEVFELTAYAPTAITISPVANVALRSADQLANGPLYRGSVIAALPWVCGITNWRWRFTEVNPLTLQTVGLPIEQNRGAASNYLNLNNVAALQFGKTYAVQSAPLFSYTGTNYQWGPVTYMAIIGSAGLIVDSSQDVLQGASQDSTKGLPEDLATHLSENLELSVYPNPSNGEGLTMTLSGVTSSNVQVKVYDALGRKIESKRYAVDGTLQTTLNFANELSNGLYILEVSTEDVTRSVRFMVEQ